MTYYSGSQQHFSSSFLCREGVAGHAGPHAVQEDQGSPDHHQILPALQGEVLHPRGGPALPGRQDHERPREAREVANPSQSSSPLRGGPTGHF